MRVVNVKLLPDGSGRVRVHWFVRSPQGVIRTGLKTEITPIGILRLGGAQGYIACQPKRENVLPTMDHGEIHLLIRSDDIRAANCPECLATEEAKKLLAEMKDTEQMASN